MPRDSEEKFRASVAKAREIEKAVAAWIKQRGSRILPVYDYCGLGNDKAPRLEAFSAADSLVTPDLLVARNGVMTWCEVKWKTLAFHYRKTNEFETGIDLRLYQNYQKVRAATGSRVYLVFAHETENVVTCDEIGVLDALPCKRQSVWGRGGHPPMVNWPLRNLHVLADYTQIVISAAA